MVKNFFTSAIFSCLLNEIVMKNFSFHSSRVITRERILMPGLFFTASIKKMPMYTKVRFEQS